MLESAREVSAGAALVRRGEEPELLLMRVRARVFELPKGHVETGESHRQAAARELCEETGLMRAPAVGAPLGTLDYRFDGTPVVNKRVHFFLFVAAGELDFASLPRPARELRWIRCDEVATIPLASENLRPLLGRAFALFDARYSSLAVTSST